MLLKPHRASESPGLKHRFPSSTCREWWVASLRWDPVTCISKKLQSAAKLHFYRPHCEQKWFRLMFIKLWNTNHLVVHETSSVGQTSKTSYESTLLILFFTSVCILSHAVIYIYYSGSQSCHFSRHICTTCIVNRKKGKTLESFKL